MAHLAEEVDVAAHGGRQAPGTEPRRGAGAAATVVARPRPDMTRVLLIEDDPAQVALLSLTLGLAEEMAIELTPTSLLSEGLEQLESARDAGHSFDVVLLDLSLPDIAGIEAVRSVLAVDPELAVVVLTGADDEN